jgi:hypothetical protein
MKGAKGLIGGTGSFQFQVASDDINDVTGLLDPGYGVFVVTQEISPKSKGQRPK